MISGGLYPLDVYDTLMGCVMLSWRTKHYNFPTGKSHTHTHTHKLNQCEAVTSHCNSSGSPRGHDEI